MFNDRFSCLISYSLLALALNHFFQTSYTTILGFYLIVAVHELGHITLAVRYNRIKRTYIQYLTPVTEISGAPRDFIKNVIIASGLITTLLAYPILIHLFESPLQYLFFAVALAAPDMVTLYTHISHTWRLGP